MRNREFLAKVQRFTAESMITNSALRRVGAAGAPRSARLFLAGLRLQGLDRLNSVGYLNWLDRVTAQLVERLPPGAQKWGPARKAINIFMRSAAYTVPLAERFRLDRVLPFL